MKLPFLIDKLLQCDWASISWINKIDIPHIDFDFGIDMELFSHEMKLLVSKIVDNIDAKAVINGLPVCHLSLKDGSEKDLYVYFLNSDHFSVLLEISHHYIDNHFLWHNLWKLDEPLNHSYPIDELFVSEGIAERTKDGQKIAESFVNPVSLYIHTSKYDLRYLLPSSDYISNINNEIINFPFYNFWKYLKMKEYSRAATCIEVLTKRVNVNQLKTDNYDVFLKAVYGLCQYLDGNFTMAFDSFILASSQYQSLGYDRNSDLCLFSAIEAGKKIDDLNLSIGTIKSIVDGMTFIRPDYKDEINNILKNYYMDVYVGVVVFCRRVIELYLRELLERTLNKPIKRVINAARLAGQIPGSSVKGLAIIGELSRINNLITDKEYNLISHIKTFGNYIHRRGGLSEVDAKYALQSCLHILHRI